MTLDQYLSLPGSPTAAEFGAMCVPTLSEASISRIRRGGQNVTRDTMLSIMGASGNLVSADGLLGAKAKAA